MWTEVGQPLRVRRSLLQLAAELHQFPPTAVTVGPHYRRYDLPRVHRAARLEPELVRPEPGQVRVPLALLQRGEVIPPRLLQLGEKRVARPLLREGLGECGDASSNGSRLK